MAKAEKKKQPKPLVTERCRTIEVTVKTSALSKWVGDSIGMDMSEYSIDDDSVIEISNEGTIGLVFTKRGPGW